jgi:hypothetical protein
LETPLPLDTGEPTRVLPAEPLRRSRPPSRRPRAALLVAAFVIALAGVAAAVLIGVLRDSDTQGATRPRDRGGATATETAPKTTEQTTTEETTPPPPPVDAAELNDQGFALMQEGDFEAARPLLEQAVQRLRGTGSLTEAFASYNLAYTRFALGICGGVLDLLDRSEAVQGHRSEIDELRREADHQCGGGRGKGKKGNGEGNGND